MAAVTSGQMSFICDLGFTLLVPAHSYWLMEDVLRDYFPQGKGANKYIALGIGAVILAGFGALTFSNGVTDTIKHLWIDEVK